MGVKKAEEIVSAALADAFRAGQIAQAQEDSKMLREQLAEAARPDQRMTLAIAIRAIERGRNLTEAEKMKNLMATLAEFDREEAACANIAKLKDEEPK